MSHRDRVDSFDSLAVILAVVHTPQLCVYQALLKCPSCSGNLCPLFCFDLGFSSPESVLCFGKHIIWMHPIFERTWFPEKLSLGLNKHWLILRRPVVDVYQTSHCGFKWGFTGVRVKSLQPCCDSSNSNWNYVISSPLMMFQMHMMPYFEVGVIGVVYSRMSRLLFSQTNHDYDSQVYIL